MALALSCSGGHEELCCNEKPLSDTEIILLLPTATDGIRSDLSEVLHFDSTLGFKLMERKNQDGVCSRYFRLDLTQTDFQAIAGRLADSGVSCQDLTLTQENCYEHTLPIDVSYILFDGVMI
jgi:hypothetical protein